MISTISISVRLCLAGSCTTTRTSEDLQAAILAASRTLENFQGRRGEAKIKRVSRILYNSAGQGCIVSGLSEPSRRTILKLSVAPAVRIIIIMHHLLFHCLEGSHCGW